MRRSHTAEDRTRAIAMAAYVGPLRAAHETGISRTTIQLWLHNRLHRGSSPRPSRTSQPSYAVPTGNHSQRSRPAPTIPKRDSATRPPRLRVPGEQLALAEGRATANIESHSYLKKDPFSVLTDDDRRNLMRMLDVTRSRGPKHAIR